MATIEPTNPIEENVYILYDGNSSYALYDYSSSRNPVYRSFPSDGFTSYEYDSEMDKYLYIGDEVTSTISNPNYRYLTSSNDDDFLSREQPSSQSGGGISMNNSVKKTIIMKRINNVLYNIFPKSSADNIVFTITNGDDTTVQLKLDDISSSLASAVTSSGLSSSIQTEFNSLYNRIMGFVNNDTTINEAYDTLKEVATYLSMHESVVTQITSDISTLQSTVGDSNSGLVKDVNDLKTTVGGSSSGLVQSNNTNISNTSTLQTTINNKSTVTSSNTNGYIKINNVNTKVYTPSNIPASAITESNTKKFVTNDEKNKVNNAAQYNVVATQPTAANANSTDLYILVTDPSYNVVVTSYTPSDIDAYTYYTIYKDSNDNYYFLYTVNNTDLYLKLLSSEESYIVDSAGGSHEPLIYKSIIGSNINSSTPHDIYNGNETLVPIPAHNEPGGGGTTPIPVVPGKD